MDLPKPIKSYLNSRGISDAVIERSGISWDGHRIAIPVRDSQGNILFKKYRRDPSLSEGPKYSYDKGATAALFNSETLRNASTVIITEGELDALVLESQGLPAVSSTGGSGTFLREWNELFREKQVFVCYDNDAAGVAGAIKVSSIIPHAQVIELPDLGGKVKDVTDFFQVAPTPFIDFTVLASKARMYRVPGEEAKIKELKDRYQDLMIERRNLLNEGGVSRYLDAVIEHLCDRIEEKKKKAKPRGPSISGTQLERAKATPITDLLKFNRDGFTRCIWHSEDTPSMHYYKERNIVKCFGCGEFGDVLDVYMKINSVTLKEALDALAPAL